MSDLFWHGCGPARSVMVVEVNGYTIEPGADLREADLADVNLKGANLEEARLNGANLKGANLFLAKLSGANLEGANLEGAHAYYTHWPDGFDPVAAGVVSVSDD